MLPSNDQFLTCSYHLDKENGTKTGDFNLIKVENDKLVKTWQSNPYDFGFLSLKQEGPDTFSLGCSDGAVRVLSIPGCQEALKYATDES